MCAFSRLHPKLPYLGPHSWIPPLLTHAPSSSQVPQPARPPSAHAHHIDGCPFRNPADCPFHKVHRAPALIPLFAHAHTSTFIVRLATPPSLMDSPVHPLLAFCSSHCPAIALPFITLHNHHASVLQGSAEPMGLVGFVPHPNPYSYPAVWQCLF